MSRLVNRNITAAAGRTSMRLEPEIWDALREICAREQIDTREFIRRIEQQSEPGGRTSAVRVHVLEYFRAAATAEGHQQAGHGALPAGAAHHSRHGGTEEQSMIMPASARVAAGAPPATAA